MDELETPAIPLPDTLSDEAAAQLLEFLYEVARIVENHYAGQLHRYYALDDERQLHLWDDPTL